MPTTRRPDPAQERAALEARRLQAAGSPRTIAGLPGTSVGSALRAEHYLKDIPEWARSLIGRTWEVDNGDGAGRGKRGELN